MNIYTRILFAALCITASNSYGAPERFFDYGRVIDVNPTYREFTREIPREQCWLETEYSRNHDNQRHNHGVGSTVAGGVIGGAVGHVIGHAVGRNKEAKIGTAIGALVGMKIGHDTHKHNTRHHNKHARRAYQVEKCKTVYDYETSRELTGYDVTYKYKGKTFYTHMQERPRKRIKLAIKVKPVG